MPWGNNTFSIIWIKYYVNLMKPVNESSCATKDSKEYKSFKLSKRRTKSYT